MDSLVGSCISEILISVSSSGNRNPDLWCKTDRPTIARQPLSHADMVIYAADSSRLSAIHKFAENKCNQNCPSVKSLFEIEQGRLSRYFFTLFPKNQELINFEVIGRTFQTNKPQTILRSHKKLPLWHNEKNRTI